MPELPEVETIRKTLTSLIVGKTIEDVKVFWPKIIRKPLETEQFRLELLGETFREVDRRGKFLIFKLDRVSLVSHLRMEGKYGLYSKEDPLEKHTHVIFSFTDGTELRYRDVRKFGTMHLFPKGEENREEPLAKLGVEPFSKDFTFDLLEQALAKTERNIKAVLLDQTIVTGLGNIYVDEALYRAKIHPERLANTLKKPEIKRLKKEIVDTLAEAVEKGGSTIRSYVNSQGEIGMFQLELMAYAQEGKPCRRCGTEIVKIRVAGRGTHICPKCQKKGK